MISATSSDSADMAAASTFSYAQAAKGEGVVPTPTPVAAPVSSHTVILSPSSSAARLVKDSTTGDMQSSPPAEPASTTSRLVFRKASSAEKTDLESIIGSEADSTFGSSRRFDVRKDEELSRLERPWRRTDKSTRSSSTATRSVDEQDSKRSRKGNNNKKTKAGDKQGNDEKEQEPEQPKIELSEAPIPTVNPWLQRKEAHLSKATPTTTSPAQTESAAAADDNKKINGTKPTSDSQINGTATKPVAKTAAAAAADLPQRNTRGSRAAVDRNEIPPSVNDAMSWPTPETAVQEEKKKVSSGTSVATDKSVDRESTEDASHSKSSRPKDKWVTYDYVPTVNFETQLPQMRGSKPRGGGAARNVNAPRPAAGGSQAGDKVAAPAQSAGKTQEPRTRREGTNGVPRTNSVPPATKRASMDAPQVREQRKVSGPAAAGAGAGAGDKSKETSPSPVNQTQPPRDRPEGNRNERGRGGYRGRGGHHAINTQNQHQHVAGGFAGGAMAGRVQGPYSPPPRQTGGHGQMFMPPPPRGRGGRNGAANNFHRMSLPNSATRLPPLQPQYGGPYDYPMPPMSAVPYQPQPYWDNMVVNMLKNQIEYYFSIENLCKDVYLRKRMDSQGFVPLHFVAAFKRVRAMSSDLAMVRAVCESSLELDLVVGEDDVERVRRQEGWENWVLPIEDRDEFARNHGPARLTFKNRPLNMGHHFNGVQGVPFTPTFVPQGEVHMQAVYGDVQMMQQQQQQHHQQQLQQAVHHSGMNGMTNGDSHRASVQLSANVPDFSPSGGVSPTVNGNHDGQTEHTNGVHAESIAQS